MNQVIKQLSSILANTYAIYLKTQNYHWHVKGSQFKSLHQLFEEQYQELALAVDELAERILIKGHQAPATFKAFQSLKTIEEGDSNHDANQMLNDLVKSHDTILKQLHEASRSATSEEDSGTEALLDERVAAHEKMKWMLDASRETP